MPKIQGRLARARTVTAARLPFAFLGEATGARVRHPDLDRSQSSRPELVAPALDPLCTRSGHWNALHVAGSPKSVHPAG